MARSYVGSAVAEANPKRSLLPAWASRCGRPRWTRARRRDGDHRVDEDACGGVLVHLEGGRGGAGVVGEREVVCLYGRADWSGVGVQFRGWPRLAERG